MKQWHLRHIQVHILPHYIFTPSYQDSQGQYVLSRAIYKDQLINAFWKQFHAIPRSLRKTFHDKTGSGKANQTQPRATYWNVIIVESAVSDKLSHLRFSNPAKRGRRNSDQRFCTKSPIPCHNPHKTKFHVTPCQRPIRIIVLICVSRIIAGTGIGCFEERKKRVKGLKKYDRNH